MVAELGLSLPFLYSFHLSAQLCSSAHQVLCWAVESEWLLLQCCNWVSFAEWQIITKLIVKTIVIYYLTVWEVKSLGTDSLTWSFSQGFLSSEVSAGAVVSSGAWIPLPSSCRPLAEVPSLWYRTEVPVFLLLVSQGSPSASRGCPQLLPYISLTS